MENGKWKIGGKAETLKAEMLKLGWRAEGGRDGGWKREDGKGAEGGGRRTGVGDKVTAEALRDAHGATGAT